MTSQGTWTYMMQHKSKVIPLLFKHILFVQNQYHANIKLICSDNGLEFLSKACQNSLRKKNFFLFLVEGNDAHEAK